jgi:hypothetical protein
LDRRVSIELALMQETLDENAEFAASGAENASTTNGPHKHNSAYDRGCDERTGRGGRHKSFTEDTTPAEPQKQAQAHPLTDTTASEPKSRVIRPQKQPSTQCRPLEDSIPSKTKVVIASIPSDPS